MKLVRTKEYKLNMGNFESLQIGATVSIDILDLYTEDEVADLTYEEQKAALKKHAHEWLKEELDPELEEAAKLSQAEKSILPEPEVERPRRTEKLRSNR